MNNSIPSIVEWAQLPATVIVGGLLIYVIMFILRSIPKALYDLEKAIKELSEWNKEYFTEGIQANKALSDELKLTSKTFWRESAAINENMKRLGDHIANLRVEIARLEGTFAKTSMNSGT